MKLPLPVKIFIEIAIACGIFVVLVMKTPLFDRAVPEWVRPIDQKNDLVMKTNVSQSIGDMNVPTNSTLSTIPTARPWYTVPSSSRKSSLYTFSDAIKPVHIYASPQADTQGSSMVDASTHNETRPVNEILASIARGQKALAQKAIYIQPAPIVSSSALVSEDIPPLYMENQKN